LGVIARQQGRGLSWNQGVTAVAGEANLPLLGASSLKAALDRDWDDPLARDQALGVVLEALAQVEGFVADHQLHSPGVQEALGAARQVRDQDVQVAPEGRRRASVGSPGTGGSVSRMRRCATAAKAAAT
jgi:hypothetical protein